MAVVVMVVVRVVLTLKFVNWISESKVVFRESPFAIRSTSSIEAWWFIRWNGGWRVSEGVRILF